MDVREILRSDAAGLLEEELEMLEEELATGDYDSVYRTECAKLIEDERHTRKVAQTKAKAAVTTGGGPDGMAPKPIGEGSRKAVTTSSAKVQIPHDVSPSVTVSADSLSPYNTVNMPKKTPYETVSADVAAIRRSEKRKSMFREYLRKQPLIDEAFLDAHLSFFDDWEMGAILDHIKLSEAFLEKYLSALDADKVATTQQFSEEFFMKHYSAFDAKLVLLKGKNAWRSKEQRSRKLDTFLRLKGVHI